MTTYPYTSTRVKTMKAKLLTSDDYLRMKKMGLFEIIRFLESGEYKEDVDKLSDKYRGNELMNLALNENLARTVNGLLNTLNKKDVQNIIKVYVNKWIFYNLKLISRVKINKLTEDDLRYSIIPISVTDYNFCIELLKNEENLIKFISSATNTNEELLKKMFRDENLSAIENEIDKAYYRKLKELIENEEVVGILKDFFTHMIDLVNIRNVLKLKYYKMDESEIRMIISTQKMDIVRKLIVADFDECVNILKNSKYKSIVDGIEKDPTIIDNNIEKSLLSFSNKLLHNKPLSIFPIFGYMISKEVEIRNLRLLLNSKANEIDEEFIDQNIVI